MSIVIPLLPLYTAIAWTGETLPLLSHYLTTLSLTQTRGVQWLDDSEQRTEQKVCAAAPYRHLSEGAETTWTVGPCAYI
jgi:hypothetical protein